MTFQFANNATAKLASAITSAAVTLNVVTGQGSVFPTPSGGAVFRASLKSSTAEEIVEVTARSSDSFTILRAKEGTTAVAFAAGDTLNLFLTKEVMEAAFQRGEIDTDGTLAANSDTKIASQKAVNTKIASTVTGLSWKQAVRAATTAPGTLASSFANGSVIDGVTLATGDRILIKNQSAGAENGIYVVAASGVPARATDADSGAELVNATVYISEGTANADTQWTCSTNAAITVGSTSLAFAQLTAGTATTFDGLVDVTITSPANGDVATYDSGSSTWKNLPASGLSSRATVTKTTASLANNAVETGTVALAKSCLLIKVTVDRACRIVLYSTSAARTADAGRVLGVPPTAGLGILAEFAPTGAGDTFCGPIVILANGDVSPATDIYYAITNMSGSTHTVQADFLHVKLES